MRPSVIAYLDPPSTRYAFEVADALHGVLGARLVGVYLYGSGTVGDFVSGSSDVDLMAVVKDPLEPEVAELATAAVSAVEPVPPTPGCDLHIVTVASAAVPQPLPPFELVMMTFIGLVQFSSPERPAEPRLNMHYVCCRRHGVALLGPPAAKMFAPRPRAWYLTQLLEEHERSTARVLDYRILNACRDWVYLEEDVIRSKREGAEWARTRLRDPSLVDDALEWHLTGHGPLLDVARAQEFITAIGDRLRAAL